MILGLDISQVQGEVPDPHWQAVAVDKRFVYCRCGVGNDASDTRFAEYVAGARAAGLAVGAYHFAYPLPSSAGHPGRDPETQAQAHYAACGGLGGAPGDLPVALDLEWPEPPAWEHWGCSAAQIVDWTVRYLAKATTLYGVAPVLYSYPYFLAALGTEALAPLAGYRLWLAAYRPFPAPVPAPWASMVMQQTGGGTYRLPNGAPCDEDVVADEATLAALVGRS